MFSNESFARIRAVRVATTCGVDGTMRRSRRKDVTKIRAFFLEGVGMYELLLVKSVKEARRRRKT